MKKIIVLTIMTFVIAIGGVMYTQYQNVKLEAEAYKVVAESRDMHPEDLQITALDHKIGDKKYNISYTYMSDGAVIGPVHMDGVEL